MALKPIMGQPVNLVPQYEQSFGCNVENKYCVLYGQDVGDETTPSETIMVEMTQEPCGGDLVVDGNFPNGDNWTIVDGDIVFADGKANHVIGSSAELSQDIIDIDLGSYYRVSVVVTGMSSGTLDLYFTQSGSYSVRITENGIYTFYLYNLGDDDGIDFVWSADCDASISGVSVYKLLDSTEIIANILDIDGNIVTSLPYAIFDEYVVFFRATYTLTEGCYTVQIVDPCAADSTEIFTNPDYSGGGSGWTLVTEDCLPDFDCSASFVGNELVQVPSETGDNNPDGKTYTYCSQAFNSDLEITEDCYLKFEIEIDPANDSQAFYFYVGDGSGGVTNLMDFTDRTAGRWSRTQFFSAGSIDPSSVDMGIYIVGSFDLGNTNIVKYAQITKIAISDGGTYISNCLKVSAETGTTRVVEGFADLVDVSSNPIKGRSLGFLFVEDYFWLKARLEVSFSNPHNGIKQDNNLFSNGRKKKAFAQATKLWDLNFIGADENMHDVISNIISCDKFTIESQEYITDEKDYQPNWNTKSMVDIADSKIEVQRIDGTRFNNND